MGIFYAYSGLAEDGKSYSKVSLSDKLLSNSLGNAHYFALVSALNCFVTLMTLKI